MTRSVWKRRRAALGRDGMALLHEDAHRPEPVGYVRNSAPGRIAINGTADRWTPLKPRHPAALRLRAEGQRLNGQVSRVLGAP